MQPLLQTLVMERVSTVRNHSDLFSLREIWKTYRTCFVFKTVAFSFLLCHWRSTARSWHHTLVKRIVYRNWFHKQGFWFNFVIAIVKKRFFCITLKRLINFCTFQIVRLFNFNWNWVLLFLLIWIIILVRFNLIGKPLILSSCTICSEIFTFSPWSNPSLIDQVERICKWIIHIFTRSSTD